MLDVLTLIPAEAESSDVAAFIAGLVPSISEARGLRSLRISAGDIMSRGGPPPFSHVIEMSFDSLADWMAWVLDPEQQQRPEGHPFDRIKPTILYFEATDPRSTRS